jgi:hypothetical protein
LLDLMSRCSHDIESNSFLLLPARMEGLDKGIAVLQRCGESERRRVTVTSSS